MKNHKLYDRLCRKCFNLLINILRRTCNDGQGEAAHSTFATAAAELDDYFKFWNMFAFRLPLVIAFAAIIPQTSTITSTSSSTSSTSMTSSISMTSSDQPKKDTPISPGKNFLKSFPIGGTVSSTTPRKSKPSRIPRPKVLEGDLELLREFQEQFLRRAPQHLPGPDPTTLSANASRPTTPSVVSRPLPQYSIKMPRLLISILITPTQIVRNNVSD
ncbi:hypothetical protein RhiirA1_462658 [Rhizophagus irregularis]|uniref:Uncharacterized protein n=1 Tax=Rhizophagus irregularis TaxID=588596 RepID=A0A2N0RLU2_9GLOM|nr:hypothetical protein RhiirA1_462658 [Rhizophagus irregularis]